MTDRELLELAAKATGLPECGWMGPAFMYVKDNTFTDWNPLTDNGDALRLAVKLGLEVRCGAVHSFLEKEGYFNATEVSYYDTASGRDYESDELHNDDPYAATRRAIVRAAAEIGKESK